MLRRNFLIVYTYTLADSYAVSSQRPAKNGHMKNMKAKIGKPSANRGQPLRGPDAAKSGTLVGW